MRKPNNTTRTNPAQSFGKVVFAALLILGLASGCSNLETKDNAAATTDASDSMLEDVLSVIPQLLEPRTNSIQFGPNIDKLGLIAVKNLANLGYGIQRVSADQGINFFSAEKIKGDAGTVTVRVSIGELEVARQYASKQGTITPTGPFELAGTRAKLDPNKSKLGSTVSNNSIISNVEYTAIAPISGGIPTISLLSDDIIAGVVNQATNGPEYTSINSNKLEVNNRFFDEEGSFASLFADRVRVAREVIIFPNDSMRLGPDGKRRINSLLRRFSEKRDLINVIGCSNGATTLEIGNEGLALGRANRITEELLTLGVPNKSILDDACWAPTSAEGRFPNRGVVVDLMRSPS